MSVILNEVKNLVESMGWKTEILRLMPQNDIATQSLAGGDEGEGEWFDKLTTITLSMSKGHPHPNPPPSRGREPLGSKEFWR